MYRYLEIYNLLELQTLFLIISVVSSLMGSMLQVSHKKLERDVKNNEVWAVYITSFCIMMLSYTIGLHYESKVITTLIGVVCAYISLDLFKGVKVLLNAIIKKLPDEILELLLRKYLDKRDKDENGK
jgi:uncharacterized membrane protein YfcA